MLLHQGIPLTQFISCPICHNEFNEKEWLPISLACGHTVCKACTVGNGGEKKCPFDQVAFPMDVDKLPANYALMQVMGAAIPEQDRESPPSSSDKPRSYLLARQCIEDMAVHLKPLAENSSEDESKAPLASRLMSEKSVSKCILSRPIQRKLISLIHCQLLEEEGRSRSARMARSIGERIVTELLSLQQYPQQLSANLWAAVRTRGCQFLGPAMQEEVLKLILLALEDGSFLSRKVLVLFVVQRLESRYPQASKTAIGHVVQLLYRASCFKVMKRDAASSLMQLKDEFRQYEVLRREHDAQVVQIALEAGLRIPPEHWSSLLYGDSSHKSHMQSVIDKHQSAQSFSQCIAELMMNLQRNGDPCDMSKLQMQLEFLSGIDPSPDCPAPSWENLEAVMRCLNSVMKAFVAFLSGPDYRMRLESIAVPNMRYKTSMCRDFSVKGMCPRGGSCTFAHSQDELDRHRVRSKRTGRKDEGEDNSDSSQMEEIELLSRLQLDPSSPHSVPPPSYLNSSKVSAVGVRPEETLVGSSDQSFVAAALMPDSSAPVRVLATGVATSHAGLDMLPAYRGQPSAPATLPQNQIPANKFGPTLPLPSTKLTFSEPAKEVPETTFYPPLGPQTSLHPHNASFGGHVAPVCAYGPPPPTMNHSTLPPAHHHLSHPHQPWLEPCPAGQRPYRPPAYHPVDARGAKLVCPPPHCQAPQAPVAVEPYGAYCSCDHCDYVNKVGGGAAAVMYPCSACQPPIMHCPQALEGPDLALQSLNEAGLMTPGSPATKDISLEYLTSRKKELICHLQEEPTFLDPMAQVYRADSAKGGFAGLKTVLGNNMRKKEPMPKLVSDMFVATRSTQSLDMFMYEDCPVYQTQWSSGEDKVQGKDGSSYSVMDGGDRKNAGASSVCTSTMQQPFVCSQVESSHMDNTNLFCDSSNQGCGTLYNSLSSSFTTCTEDLLLQETSCSKSSSSDMEFCRFPNDDDETFIPFEHTSVSKFGPISRMARAKTNNCAPVQVTANSSKRTTPVLAVTPLERPVPNSIPVTSQFGSTTAVNSLMANPAVKPTPTEAPSIWQESLQPSFMNIARLKAGAAGAISNNERLAYELQAVELQISLKTGKVPEPVGKIIQEAVMGNFPATKDSNLTPIDCHIVEAKTHNGDAYPPSNLGQLSHGHVTDCLTMIEHGKSMVSAEKAARHIMEEYQRSFQGLKK